MADVASGKLWTYLLNAILIAVPTSFVVLVWYRHVVSRMMHVAHAAKKTIYLDHGSSAAVIAAPDLFPGLDITVHALIENRLSLRRRRLAITYGLAGAVAAGTMAVLFIASMQFDIRPRGAFAAWYVFCWPIIPTSVVLLALPQSRNITLLLGYAGVGAAIIFIWAAISAWALGDAAVHPLQS